jgi:TolB-like protein
MDGRTSGSVVVMKATKLILILMAALAFAGCGGSSATKFVHPDYNFGYLERVAVVPMENLTNDQGAGARLSRFFVTELLSTEAFDVVEPGEVAQAMASMSLVRTAELTREQAVELGAKLSAQGLFLGSIAESATARSGGSTVNFVTVTVRLVETDTGQTVWSATHTKDSKSFWATMFGTADRSMAEVTRECVHEALETLVN